MHLGWEHLNEWLEARLEIPVGALLRVVGGADGGGAWSAASARPPWAI